MYKLHKALTSLASQQPTYAAAIMLFQHMRGWHHSDSVGGSSACCNKKRFASFLSHSIIEHGHCFEIQWNVIELVVMVMKRDAVAKYFGLKVFNGHSEV